jgi:hypothetical protein
MAVPRWLDKAIQWEFVLEVLFIVGLFVVGGVLFLVESC